MDTLKRLDELLDERHMTLWDMAKSYDINYPTLKMAHKRGTQLSVCLIEQICGGFGIPLSQFFEESLHNDI